MGSIQNLAHEEALEIFNNVYNSILSDKKSVCVCITERGGTVIIRFSMNDVRPITAHVAELKAKQAAFTAERTRWLRDKVEAEEFTLELFGLTRRDYVPWAGGVPIYSPDRILLGGIGISNLDEDEDEEYAIRAVEQAGFLSNRT
jgi:uncharacterized protein GlcG (DUF336 family)